MKCFVWSVELYGAETWTLAGNSKNDWKSIRNVDMENDEACRTDRQNKKCSKLERMGEGRILLELIKKRKRN